VFPACAIASTRMPDNKPAPLPPDAQRDPLPPDAAPAGSNKELPPDSRRDPVPPDAVRDAPAPPDKQG